LKYIKEVSIYILSVDNLTKRNDHTLQIIGDGLKIILSALQESPEKAHQLRIRFVGEMHLLPEHMRTVCDDIEKLANNENGFQITAAMAYDPIEDCRKLLNNDSDRHGIKQRPIDLVVRTGGQLRSSGFYPLHCMYAEWVYLDKMFPDLTCEDLTEALRIFYSRQRRFGA
jgi:undecaprenyl diphosphate synthase